VKTSAPSVQKEVKLGV